MYAVYRYEKGLPEKAVALLYASGFASGAISAPVAGYLADRHGRRLACLAYCLCCSLACLTIFTNNLAILFAGRLLGGIATTLLLSAFEAWMISDFHARGLYQSSLTLSGMFSNMTGLSGAVAVASGVAGDALVGVFGTGAAPFGENLGRSALSPPFDTKKGPGIFKTLTDGEFASLWVMSCFFEGAMYLFVFFWPAALQSARSAAGKSQEELPFGIVFSCFMCSMVAGSAVLPLLKSLLPGNTASVLVMVVALIVSGCLSVATMTGSEHTIFWIFCLVEVAIGAYFPAMALVKSEKVESSVRGSVYSILRLPLNAFVVGMHCLDEEGMKPSRVDLHEND
ncbi:hypothetical protein ACJ41O_009588 [Fusarium nematophilum]